MLMYPGVEVVRVQYAAKYLKYTSANLYKHKVQWYRHALRSEQLRDGAFTPVLPDGSVC